LRDLLIADAGPLIALARIDRLWLLPRLCARTITTEIVWSECFANPSDVEQARLNQADAAGWVERVAVPPLTHDWRLGRGETSAITLALVHQAAVLIDERAARRTAARLGLPLIGTVGLLTLAKQRELIPAIREDLYHLAASGYRLSPDLLANALAFVDEIP
jgi:predicted nucleic acid-binding protein